MLDNIINILQENKNKIVAVMGSVIVATLVVALYTVANATTNNDPYAQSTLTSPFTIELSSCIFTGGTNSENSNLHNHNGKLYSGGAPYTSDKLFNGCLSYGGGITVTRDANNNIQITYPAVGQRSNILYSQYKDGDAIEWTYCPALAKPPSTPSGRGGRVSFAKWDWDNCNGTINGKRMAMIQYTTNTPNNNSGYEGVIMGECKDATCGGQCTITNDVDPCGPTSKLTAPVIEKAQRTNYNSSYIYVNWPPVANAGDVYEIQYCNKATTCGTGNDYTGWIFFLSGRSYYERDGGALKYYGIIKDLSPGTYKVRVKAQGVGLAYDNSPWSTIREVTTL